MNLSKKIDFLSTKKIWEKAKNLLKIKWDKEKGNSLYNIPNFIVVWSDLFLKWSNNKSIDEEINKLFEKTKIELNIKNIDWWKEKIIVRSSAIYSEDNEKNTWAWIYDSIIIDNLNIKEFKKTLIKIFKSVNSKRALDYRDSIWIKKEEMWLIIQKYINCEFFWQINSKYLDNVLQINLNDQKIFLNKDDWGFHIPFDVYKLNNYLLDEEIEIIKNRLLEISNYFEKSFWHPIQIEYWFNVNYKNIDIYLFQIRTLPKNFWEFKKIDFRKDKHLFEFNSLWIIDEVLDIKTYKNTTIFNNEYQKITKQLINYNNDKKLIVYWNWVCASMNNNIIKSFPKEWCVLSLWRYSNSHWHIETMCLEKWITILSKDMMESDTHFILDTLNIFKKVHVQSNWINSKIFSPIINQEKVFDWILDFIKNRNDWYSFVDKTYIYFEESFYSELKEEIKNVNLDYVLDLMYNLWILEKYNLNSMETNEYWEIFWYKIKREF